MTRSMDNVAVVTPAGPTGPEGYHVLMVEEAKLYSLFMTCGVWNSMLKNCRFPSRIVPKGPDVVVNINHQVG